MRAKLVNEAASFQRYKDPKKALFPDPPFGKNSGEAEKIIRELLDEIDEEALVQEISISSQGDSITFAVSPYTHSNELKPLLAALGILTTGRGERDFEEDADYTYYKYPIKKIF